MTEYSSKHGNVSKAPYELYMMFVDMRNFTQYLPDDKKDSVQADFDTIKAEVQGFTIGAKVTSRYPYSRITIADDGAPFNFNVGLFFDPGTDPGCTDFHIDLAADLNFMMKMMLGNKIKQALDKVVDGLVCVSEGRMPEGVDPSMFEKMKNGQF